MLKTSLAGLGILILLPAAILSSACGDDDDANENEVTATEAESESGDLPQLALVAATPAEVTKVKS